MIIKNFIIDKKVYSILPEQINHKNLFLQLRFICLKRKILVDFKKILSLYQISIVRILNFDYVKSFKMDENEHISLLANRLISGLNKNEINFGEKYDKNLGFFEKFFKFFT